MASEYVPIIIYHFYKGTSHFSSLDFKISLNKYLPTSFFVFETIKNNRSPKSILLNIVTESASINVPNHINVNIPAILIDH